MFNDLKLKFKKFYSQQDKFIFWLNSSCFLIALIVLLSWLIILPYLPPKIPLFYSLPWGENQLAHKNQLILLPALIFLTTFINIIVSWHLHKSQNFIKKIIASSSLLFGLLLLIATIKIILVFI